jgi:hypothetical protein
LIDRDHQLRVAPLSGCRLKPRYQLTRAGRAVVFGVEQDPADLAATDPVNEGCGGDCARHSSDDRLPDQQAKRYHG